MVRAFDFTKQSVMSKPARTASPAQVQPTRTRVRAPALSIAYPNACGSGWRTRWPRARAIDISSTSHFVAVPGDRDDEPVREFPAFTADLERLVRWLRECDITTVAMESTGVCWIPLYEMLDSAGFEANLVNARHVKNVRRTLPPASGAKSHQTSP